MLEAASYGSADIMKLLYERGATYSKEVMITAAWYGCKEIVKFAQDWGPKYFNEAKLEGYDKAIDMVAWCGHREIMMLLKS